MFGVRQLAIRKDRFDSAIESKSSWENGPYVAVAYRSNKKKERERITSILSRTLSRNVNSSTADRIACDIATGNYKNADVDDTRI